MHWIFYVIAAAVTALAIYVQMKRMDKIEKEGEQTEVTSAPAEEKAKTKKSSK